jgi:hypothetical protein
MRLEAQEAHVDRREEGESHHVRVPRRVPVDSTGPLLRRTRQTGPPILPKLAGGRCGAVGAKAARLVNSDPFMNRLPCVKRKAVAALQPCDAACVRGSKKPL